MTVVGHVAALWRYPVKSMQAEALDAVEVSWHGLAGDRRWAFIRDGQVPRLRDPARPDAGAVLVRTPGGRELDVADPALAAELRPGVRVIKQDRGVFDSLPLSVLSTQALAGLGQLAGRDLAAQRFRPNILVDAPGPGFPEDGWVGATLRLGGLRMRVDKPDQRCVVVTVDPVTLDRDRSVLATIARQRGNQLGVYGSTVLPGRVAVGDPVELEP